jgi:GTP 3',8-cyclase
METFDRYRIDSHKLMYHADRVSQWLKGVNIYPVYIEVGLSQGCNHRCIFCAFDYIGYRPVYLPTASFYRFVRSAARNGVKSIMFAGEGEPLLHPDVSDIVARTKNEGIDVAMTSNAVFFTRRVARECLPHLSWFRASIDAGTARTYAGIHRAPPADFNIVLDNLAAAVEIKRKSGSACVIGGQFLLLRENYDEAARLVCTLRRIGLEYVIIKPYSRHPSSLNRPAADFSAADLSALEARLLKYSRHDFQVFFRNNAMRKKQSPKPYTRCVGMPFITHMTATGDLYPCSNFVGVKDFSLGNICNKPFSSVWNSRRKTRIMNDLRDRWNVKLCRQGCRLDEINRYLHDLRQPCSHVNFI